MDKQELLKEYQDVLRVKLRTFSSHQVEST